MIFLYIDGLVSPLRVQYPLPDARQVEATNWIQHAAECMMQAGSRADGVGRGAWQALLIILTPGLPASLTVYHDPMARDDSGRDGSEEDDDTSLQICSSVSSRFLK